MAQTQKVVGRAGLEPATSAFLNPAEACFVRAASGSF